MRVNELESMSEEKLLDAANDCFIIAEQGSDEHGQPLGYSGTIRLLFEGQLYLSAASKKREDRISTARESRENRKYWFGVLIEILVVVLIGWELKEGYKQADVLEKLRESTEATATAMKAAGANLESLNQQQSKSLDRLNEMNEKLQASLTQTGRMASAIGQQLDILKKEQAEREAQLAKKPKPVLYVGSTQLLSTPPNTPILPSEQTDTSTSFELILKNEGDANATGIEFNVTIFSKDVTLDTPGRHGEVHLPADSTTRVFTIQYDHLRRGVQTLAPIKFLYTKGHAPFPVLFDIEANEIPAGTPLGMLMVGPRQPAP
jgi:hypothetical protein